MDSDFDFGGEGDGLTKRDIEKLKVEIHNGHCKHVNITRHRPYDGKGDCLDCDDMIYLNGRLDG